jgi:hypothetical protein
MSVPIISHSVFRILIPRKVTVNAGMERLRGCFLPKNSIFPEKTKDGLLTLLSTMNTSLYKGAPAGGL